MHVLINFRTLFIDTDGLEICQTPSRAVAPNCYGARMAPIDTAHPINTVHICIPQVGLLCAQNCCVLPIVFALYAWYVYGLLSLSQAGVCSQRLKRSLCISAAWFFLYSLYQLCNLWSTEKADKAEFFNRINREQPEGVPFSLQAELSWNTEVEDWI